MEDLLKKMEEHLNQLKTGYERQKANIHAQEGAIQECEKWIKEIKEAQHVVS